MDEYKYQIVLQLPGTTRQDYDSLLSLENLLAKALDGSPHNVDGHDFGSGTGNIFIDTNDPVGAFELTKKILDVTDYPMLKSAYRSFEEDDYVLIWPENSQDEFKLI